MSLDALGVLGPLCDAIAERVAQKLDARPRPAALPRLLDRNGLAEVLGCSAGHVDKLRQRGMPCIRLGESPRFELEPCLAWLRAQKGGEP